MRPRGRVLRVLLLVIAVVHFSTTTSSAAAAQQLQPLILRLSPKKPAEKLDDIPDRWIPVQNGEYRAPQMEIHLLKDQVSPNENWYYMNEHKSFWPNHDARTSSATSDERKVLARFEDDEKLGESMPEFDDALDDIVMPDRMIPRVPDFRNIIRVPTFCPTGEREDSKGRCRPALEFQLETKDKRRCRKKHNFDAISTTIFAACT